MKKYFFALFINIFLSAPAFASSLGVENNSDEKNIQTDNFSAESSSAEHHRAAFDTHGQHAADAMNRAMSSMSMSDATHTKFIVRKLELKNPSADFLNTPNRTEARSVNWDAAVEWGSAVNKIIARSEGERSAGHTTELEQHLLWQHALSPFSDSIMGLRHDANPSRTWLVAGVQGTAPYSLELAAVAYIGNANRRALKLEAHYDAALTQRVLLQPSVELHISGKTDAQTSTGHGLSSSRAGLRLRYEVCRNFSPYLGMEWNKTYGTTADIAHSNGERSASTNALLGVQAWF